MVFPKDSSEEELKDLPKWQKIFDSGVKVFLKRFIEDDEVVTKPELMLLWDKNKKTIERYVKAGMPLHKNSVARFQIFSVKEVTAWRTGTVDQTMSDRTKNIDPSVLDHTEDIATEEIKTRSDLSRKYSADAENAELIVQLNQMKLDTAKGSLVPADDLDRAMSELAIVHKTDKIHDENLLPALLQNKDAGEIKQLLQEHNFERLEMLDKIVNKEFKSTETMYDIVEAVLHQLKDGVEPESLVKRINGSLV